MGAIRLPEGTNVPETIRKLRAIDAEFFGSMYATSGTLGDLTIEGVLTIGEAGSIRSASTGLRYELTDTDTYAKLDFYSGHASETSPGFLRLIGGVTPTMALWSPTVTGVDTALSLDRKAHV